MVVRALVNGEDKGDLFVLRTPEGDFFLKRTDAEAAGLRLAGPEVEVEGERYLSLRGQAGLVFQLEPRQLVLDITADPKLLPRTRLDAGSRPRRATLLPGGGAFLNWSLDHSRSREFSSAGASFEAGAHVGPFLVQSTAATVDSATGRRLVRLLSSAIRDDPQRLERFTVGDFFVSAPELGGHANLGGVALTKLYSIDPYHLRYPTVRLEGQVSLPSEVEVLVDGRRVRVERVRPGEFQIENLQTQLGARSVQLVIRDNFGRVEQIDYSQYVSDQLLRGGTTEFNYAAGALRRNFGFASNDYGPLAFSGFHRWGLTDTTTLGARAEGRRGFLNAGVAGTFNLGDFGLFSASLARSQAEGLTGHALLLRHSYQSSRFTTGVFLRRDTAGYMALADPLVLHRRKAEGLLYASWLLRGFGSVAFSHSFLRAYPTRPSVAAGYVVAPLPNSKVTAVTYTGPLQAGRSSFTAGLSRTEDDRGTRTELNVGITAYFEPDRIASASFRGNRDFHTTTVGLSQPAPAGEGWGYDLFGSHSEEAGEDRLQLRASAQLNTRRAILRAEQLWERHEQQGNGTTRFAAAGGLAWIDGRLYAGRPIQDSFVVARVGELQDIPVSVNGRVVGETDARGMLLVPSVPSYSEIELGLDGRSVPIEYKVQQLTRRVVLPPRSGAVVDFGASRVQAVTGSLLSADGSPLSLAEVTVRGAVTRNSTSGARGELYFEEMPVGRYSGEARQGEQACRFELEVPASQELFVEVGALRCR